MLLFNLLLLLVCTCTAAFQNISCYCLTKLKDFFLQLREISKHLMLLFNTKPLAQLPEEQVFQNISCYCLTRPELPESI